MQCKASVNLRFIYFKASLDSGRMSDHGVMGCWKIFLVIMFKNYLQINIIIFIYFFTLAFFQVCIYAWNKLWKFEAYIFIIIMAWLLSQY